MPRPAPAPIRLFSADLDRASPAAICELSEQLADAGLSVKIVYSSVRDLDVLPCNATKGGALEWLCAQLGVPLDRVLVAGDTGNDASMFRLRGVRGIVVENALPELFAATVDIPTFTSRRILAGGVLDGLRHYGVIAAIPPAGNRRPAGPDSGFRQLFTGTKLGGLSARDRALLGDAHEHALLALRKNITPLGFSACSLADNTVSGTDANYRSVWARDGGFTVWCTAHLEDEEMRTARTATLETLLNAAAANGQIPANVRVDDGRPEYSGVGNIASIDSGLWVMIALYNHANITGDHSLLYRRADRLQTVMNWLGALDWAFTTSRAASSCGSRR